MVLFNFGRYQREYAPKTRLVSRFLGWYGISLKECTRTRDNPTARVLWRCSMSVCATTATRDILPSRGTLTCGQGLTLVHFLAQHKRFMWDRGSSRGSYS